MKQICNILSISLPSPNTISAEDISNLILNNEISLDIWCIKNFYEKHALVVDTHLDSLENTILPARYKNHPLVALIFLFLNKNQIFMEIYIKSYWQKLREVHIEHSYLPLKREHADIIAKKKRSIAYYLKKKDKPHYYSQKIIGPVHENDRSYFMYQSQHSYKQKKDIDRSRISKPFTKFPFCFDYQKNTVEIHYNSNYFYKDKVKIQRLVERIARYTKLVFHQMDDPIVADFKFDAVFNSLNKGKDEISEESLNLLKVVGISFSQTSGLTDKIPLEIPKNRKEKDIRPAIKDLLAKDVISENNLKRDVKQIIVQFKKLRPREVNIEIDRLTMTYKIDRSYLSPDTLEEIKNSCNLILKIPIDQKIDLSQLPSNRWYLIQDLLHEQELRPNSIQQTEISKLEAKGIITTKPLTYRMCLICSQKYKTGEIECTNCGSPNTRSVNKDLIEIKLPKNNINSYIVDILKKENIKILNACAIRTYVNRHQFIEVELKDKKAFIYLAFGPLNNKLFNFFRRSAMPILFVIVCNSSQEESIKLTTHFLYQNFATLYIENSDNNLQPDHFTRKLNETISESEAKIAGNASSSVVAITDYYINNGNMDEISLEDDAFNIIKFIFRDAEKWGRIMKTKEDRRLPEGIAGTNFIKRDRLFKGALVHDCKFTEDRDGYDLNISEKRKACDYIKRIKNSKELKSFGGKLSSYLIISNRIRPRQFKNFTEFIKQNSNWKGNMIIIKPENLVKLYKKINSNFNIIIQDYNKFKESLYSLFCKKRRISHLTDYHEITEQDIDSTFIYLGPVTSPRVEITTPLQQSHKPKNMVNLEKKEIINKRE